MLPALTHTTPPSPISPLEGTFVATDEPTLTHHHHPEPIVYIGFTLALVYSVGLDQ